MKTDIQIRLARPADLDVVERLETMVFDSDELSRRSLRYYIASPTACFLVMEDEGGIIGDAIVAFRQNSGVARLYSLAIRPDRAGRGYGRHLLAACEAAVRDRGGRALRLEVRCDNNAAIRLYERAGYREFGRHLDYYEDGTAALRFEKAITSPGGAAAATGNAGTS